MIRTCFYEISNKYLILINDRKQLGYECLKDTLCGNKQLMNSIYNLDLKGY